MTTAERRLVSDALSVAIGQLIAALKHHNEGQDKYAIANILSVKEALEDCAIFIAADAKIDELEGGK